MMRRNSSCIVLLTKARELFPHRIIHDQYVREIARECPRPSKFQVHFAHRHGSLLHPGIQAGCLDMACKAELLKEKNAIVTEIDFIPGER
jgi:hypothetical protein